MRPIRHPGRATPRGWRWLAIVLLLTGGVVSPASAAPADHETRFVELINDARTARSLPKLRSDPELQRVAAAWTRKMAAAGKLAHNANLRTDVRGPWSKLGENVGRGGLPEEIQRAFEASPAHLRNIIDPDFESVAVAVVEVGDMIYVTEQFRGGGPPPKNVPDVFVADTPSSLGSATTSPGAPSTTPVTLSVVAASSSRRALTAPPTSISILGGRPTR